MSVAELPRPAAEFERTPPQDITAEQCVLGGMLLSKDAIADVVEMLRAPDFYRPAHQMLYDTILDLYGRGEPADAVTLAAELTKRGEIARVGGAPYLHTLIASVPTAANASYYARIVHERAVLRRLVEAGTRIAQMGYTADGSDADDVVDRAQAEIYAVTERRASEDYLPLSAIMEGTLDEIEAIGSRGGQMVGVPTGFGDLDQLTNGLHAGQMIIIAARPAIGKALALDTPLPTPSGWTTMGEVGVGDQVFGPDGLPTTVVATTDVMHGRPCFEVQFSDGTVIVADSDHQWLTETRASQQSVQAAVGDNRYRNQRTFAEIRTTAEIAQTLQCDTADRRLNHAVTNAAPLQLPDADLPLPPYVLGVWLGGGDAVSSRFTTADARYVSSPVPAPTCPDCGAPSSGFRRCQRRHDDHGSARALLRELGVFKNKHIPRSYLRASERQRRQLLAGLLDTDGTVSPTGATQFAVTNERLARDTYELIVSLGYRCAVTTKTVRGRTPSSSTAYTLTFSPPDQVFRLQRKQQMHDERVRRSPVVHKRFITAVRETASVPVRCIQVDNDDGLYLASRAMIRTHNSTLGLDIARSASIKHGLPSVIFSLEMGRNEITMRLLSAEARVALHHMRSGTMSDDDWARLARRMGEVSSAPLFIDDSPNMSMMEIRAKCRRLKQRHDLRLVILDYMQLMSSAKRVENRQQEVSEFSRSLKLLAKELDVPVVAISQLNRGPEQRQDKKPLLSDLRESGCLTEDTTLMRADTGAPITFRELLDHGHDGVLLWSLDDEHRMVPAPVTNVFFSGVKRIFRLRLASGREIKATGNHKFLTFDGWRRLDSLASGARIAIPRRVPEPLGPGLAWSEERIGLLAHLLGDGCVLRNQLVHYTAQDEANLEFVESAAATEFGISPRRVRQENWWHVHLPAPYHYPHGKLNPLHAWFRELGIENLRSYEKRLPAVLHSASNDEVAVFLRHLWATEGNVTVPPVGSTTANSVYYSTTSRALADGVALLLARFGIVARIKTVLKSGYRPGYMVVVADAPGLRTFCERIAVHGRRGELAQRLLLKVADKAGTANVDRLPREAWDLVEAERRRAGREIATDDIFWDRIVAIESLGDQHVYDATVKGTHNFIADGIVAHNSLEQDSDMVILLHREDAYERESPRAGEADLIVAKHRNGPTATITVAFQGHYSRFVDMAQT